jgi:PncC family amidohydrolase
LQDTADLRFEADGPERERARVRGETKALLGKFLFGIDSGDLAEVVGHRLRDRHETVAHAESCTGGGLAAWIASIPGASAYLLEGAVVYANDAKVRTCAVDPAVLERHGAVSEPVARQLAEGIKNRAGATWGIGITGIAGPDGGTPDKPVGTVHFGVAGFPRHRARAGAVLGDRARAPTPRRRLGAPTSRKASADRFPEVDEGLAEVGDRDRRRPIPMRSAARACRSLRALAGTERQTSPPVAADDSSLPFSAWPLAKVSHEARPLPRRAAPSHRCRRSARRISRRATACRDVPKSLGSARHRRVR